MSPQTLEWGDMYIYSNLHGVDEYGAAIWDWSKCNVETIEGTSYYTLEVENIECVEYEYSAVLINNNEEIPATDGLTSDWWTSHRVDASDYGANNSFTPDEAYFEDETEEPIIYINQNATQAQLSYILPENGYLISDEGQSFTLSLNLTYGEESVTCPDFGSLYIIGGWHVNATGGWDEWDELTYNSVTGLYETTLSTDDLIYAATYSYDIVFIHDNQSYDEWNNKLTSSDRYMTLSWTESKTLSHEDSCSLDIDPSNFHTLATGGDEMMTIYFNLQNSDSTVYDVGYGYNLYICGDWDSWAQFYLCEYDATYSAGNQVFYRAELPIKAARAYSFDIVRPWYQNTEPNSEWSNIDKIITNQGFDAQMYIDATEFSYRYSIETFYTNGYGNYQTS